MKESYVKSLMELRKVLNDKCLMLMEKNVEGDDGNGKRSEVSEV